MERRGENRVLGRQFLNTSKDQASSGYDCAVLAFTLYPVYCKL